MNDSLQTSLGAISLTDTGGDKPPVVFLHGNSACKEVFSSQIAGDLSGKYRLLALDFPGHGASDDAPDGAYTIGRFAALVEEVMQALSLDRSVVVGWSLGGHVAVELAARAPGHMAGLVISGTPPVDPGSNDLSRAFRASDVMELTAKEVFTPGDARSYAIATMGRPALASSHLMSMVQRADGRCRASILADWSRRGAGESAIALISGWRQPIAVMQGENDAFVPLQYLHSLPWHNLWRGEVQLFRGVGHAPFLEDPERFNSKLGAYLSDVLGDELATP